MADSEFQYEHERYQRFNESLDEAGTIQIAGTEFLPTHRLKLYLYQLIKTEINNV